MLRGEPGERRVAVEHPLGRGEDVQGRGGGARQHVGGREMHQTEETPQPDG